MAAQGTAGITPKRTLSAEELLAKSMEYGRLIYSIKDLRLERINRFYDLSGNVDQHKEFEGGPIRDAEALAEKYGLSRDDRIKGIAEAFFVLPGAADRILSWVEDYIREAKAEFHSYNVSADNLSRRGLHEESAKAYGELATFSERRQLPESNITYCLAEAAVEFREAKMFGEEERVRNMLRGHEKI